MTPDRNATRTQIIRRLNGSGFKPNMIHEVLRMIDAIMTGRDTLAHVLVAATEVCKVCELGRTQQYITRALVCLMDEIALRQARSPDANTDTTGAMRGEVPPWARADRKGHLPWIRGWSSGSWRSVRDAAMNVEIAFEEEAPRAVIAKTFDC